MEKEKKIYRVLIADDHRVVRDGIEALIEDEEHYQVVAKVGNGKEALAKIDEADIVILDLDMPEMGGLEFLRKVRGMNSDLKIIVLTMTEKEEKIRTAVESGANGYVLKNSGAEELIKALKSVKDGGFHFCASATDIIMRNLSGFEDKETITVDDITPREHEVLQLICDELTNAEIAEKLFLSIRTVDTHRSNLLQKVGAKNTAGLVKFAINTGIVSSGQ